MLFVISPVICATRFDSNVTIHNVLFKTNVHLAIQHDSDVTACDILLRLTIILQKSNFERRYLFSQHATIMLNHAAVDFPKLQSLYTH